MVQFAFISQIYELPFFTSEGSYKRLNALEVKYQKIACFLMLSF